MKHRIGFNRLGRNVSHRQALYRSMATALFKYERIRTTKPKAKEIRRVAEKMISRARTDSVHNRRTIGKRIKDQAVLAKLFTDIAPRFKDRPGGYTRILKLGQRYGDASEMVLLELVERAEPAPRRKKKETAKAEAEPAKAKSDSGEPAGAKSPKAEKPARTGRGAARAKGAAAPKGAAPEPAAADAPVAVKGGPSGGAAATEGAEEALPTPAASPGGAETQPPAAGKQNEEA